jgi:DNA-binding NarL/FixJ family response regulator
MPKHHPASGEHEVNEGQAPRPIRVLVSAQHALVRAGIRALVEQILEVEVVEETAGGAESLELIKQHNPDVLLVDITFPSVSALESLKEIVANFPRVRVLVITLQENEEYAVQAFRAGATGYIPKSAASTEFVKAVKAVASGENYVAPQISKEAILQYLRIPDAFLAELTTRQRQVLQMIAEGYATKEIARTLNISVKTVETHRAQLMDRLNIHDIAGLVRYAIKMGLVSLERAPEKKKGGGGNFILPFGNLLFSVSALLRIFLS